MECFKAKHKNYFNLLHKCIGNIKQTWLTINAVMNRSRKENDILPQNINGSVCTDGKLIAHHFNEYFSNIGQTVFNKFDQNDTDLFKNYLDMPTFNIF